jgi:Peptidase inhibitor I78 family
MVTGWKFAAAALLPLAGLLLACQPEPAPQIVADMCGAGDLQGLVGQSQAVLQTMKFGQTTRIIRPGMAVTMDYSETRLNIWIGENGMIERVTCG